MRPLPRNRSGLLARATCLLALLAGAACGDEPTRPIEPRDTTRPVVVLRRPAGDTLYSDSPQQYMEGTATDSAGVVRVTYQLNGGQEQEVGVRAGASVAFTFPVALAGGENTLVVHAYDAAGNRGSTPARRLLRDESRPVVQLVSPQPRSLLAEDTARVTFRASDPTGLGTVFYSLNSGPTRQLALGDTAVTFVIAVPLRTGENLLAVHVYDRAQNSTSTVVTLYRRGITLRDVAVGKEHACALTPAGAPYCWGSNWYGGLGIGVRSYDNRTEPVPVTGGRTLRAVTVGFRVSCGLDRSGAAFCWGDNLYGAVGVSSYGIFDSPVAVEGGLKFREVSAGAEHTCGVTPGDMAYCWGNNEKGAVGAEGWIVRVPSPVAGGISFRAIRAGSSYTCALTPAGKAYCWGANDYGQLGTGTRSAAVAPAPVAGEHAFATLATGWVHTCALDAGGRAYCWGSNFVGELGTGEYQQGAVPTLAPVPVKTASAFTALALGDSHTCALDAQGSAWCWGDNTQGQLGTGDAAGSAAPRRVSDTLRFRAISARTSRTCAVTTDDALYCWGAGQRLPTPVTTGG